MKAKSQFTTALPKIPPTMKSIPRHVNKLFCPKIKIVPANICYNSSLHRVMIKFMLNMFVLAVVT